jgi:hypothetical protein
MFQKKRGRRPKDWKPPFPQHLQVKKLKNKNKKIIFDKYARGDITDLMNGPWSANQTLPQKSHQV